MENSKRNGTIPNWLGGGLALAAALLCVGVFAAQVRAVAPFEPALKADSFAARLSAAALARTKDKVVYDGSYVRIAYPMGDVAPDRGVCTDVVVRAYRALGIDLQRRVHQDMKRAFRRYPRIWGLKRPDPNIDHRRVPNLQTFLRRHGRALPVSEKAADYRPGDLVTWTVGGNLPHIGIVANRASDDGWRPMIVHNIGAGPKLEDMLFNYPITGHYRYHPAN